MRIPAGNGKIQQHNNIQRQQNSCYALSFIKLLPFIQKYRDRAKHRKGYHRNDNPVNKYFGKIVRQSPNCGYHLSISLKKSLV